MKKQTIIILSLFAATAAFSSKRADAGDSNKKLKPALETTEVSVDRQVLPEKRPGFRFPPHWGHPPRIQVRDHVKLPGKFGFGSSTVAKWIIENLKKDGKEKPIIEPRPKLPVKPVRSPEMVEKLKLLHEKKKEMAEVRKELAEDLKGKSKKEAILLVRNFKEANKQKHLEIKEAQKAVIEGIRSRKQTGAKRD
jgi:hypothetical protein